MVSPFWTSYFVENKTHKTHYNAIEDEKLGYLESCSEPERDDGVSVELSPYVEY